MYYRYREELLKKINKIFKVFFISFLIIAIITMITELTLNIFKETNDITGKIISIIFFSSGTIAYSYILYAYLYGK